MSSLARRWSWKKWAPDIGENLEGEEPLLFLEIATGLTARQLADVAETLLKAREVKYVKPELPAEATGEEVSAALEAAGKAWLASIRAISVEAFGPYVRVAGGPHTVDGQPLATLDDYFKLVEDGADLGFRARREVELALSRYNSIEGPDELFSQRSSGGARSTGRTARTAAR